MRCGRLALARGHSGEPQDREDPGLLLRFVPEFGRSCHRGILPPWEIVKIHGRFQKSSSLFHFSKNPRWCKNSTVVILAEVGPIGDAAPQALRGLRGGWRSPRRRLRAHGPGRAGVGLHPELQNRVRLLPVAQPQTYPAMGAGDGAGCVQPQGGREHRSTQKAGGAGWRAVRCGSGGPSRSSPPC